MSYLLIGTFAFVLFIIYDINSVTVNYKVFHGLLLLRLLFSGRGDGGAYLVHRYGNDVVYRAHARFHADGDHFYGSACLHTFFRDPFRGHLYKIRYKTQNLHHRILCSQQASRYVVVHGFLFFSLACIIR